MKNIIIILLLSLISLNLSPNAKAAQLDTKTFAHLPILFEGRIKPMDSFARLHLNQFSQREEIEKMNANAWLMEVLFDPASAAQRDVFFIQDKELKNLLDLNENKKHFSLIALQPGLKKTRAQVETLIAQDATEKTAQQSQLLQLHDNVLSFIQLMRSLSLILPLDIKLPAKYQSQISSATNDYMAISKLEPQILDDLKSIVARKGEDLNNYSAEEAEIAALSFHLQTFRIAGERNVSLRIFPGAWGEKGGEWYAPWALILHGQGAPQSKDYLNAWKNMAIAFRTQNTQQWESASQSAYALTQSKISGFKVKLEILYNAFKPFHWALALYAASILLLLGTLRASGALLQITAPATMALGAFIHSGGIITRILLLDRPPVGTLYESVIFVSLICALFAVIMYLRTQNKAALFAGAVSAAAMLIIAPYIIPSGQSMEMLVAVLNTNFWLATHVLCITIGYAVSVFAACLAHGYLLMRIKGAAAKSLKKLQSSIYKISIAALFFTAVGTALGGIWADQSWGRFWGWDPKENGALLIVLWIIWLQHGRLSGHLKPLAFVAGTAYLNIIVALAWFGVNLLSVGLHSYGFIDGILYGLIIFCAAETTIIGGAWAFIRYKEKKTEHRT